LQTHHKKFPSHRPRSSRAKCPFFSLGDRLTKAQENPEDTFQEAEADRENHFRKRMNDIIDSSRKKTTWTRAFWNTRNDLGVRSVLEVRRRVAAA
jgi:hypothetical protein